MDNCFREVGLCGGVVNLAVETAHLACSAAAVTPEWTRCPGPRAAPPVLFFGPAVRVATCAAAEAVPGLLGTPFALCLLFSLLLLLHLNLKFGEVVDLLG